MREVNDERVNEICGTCIHCFGPIILSCRNPKSEFNNGPVDPQGYCPKYQRKPGVLTRGDA